MKTLCLIIAIMFAGFAQIKAQSPKLNFVGGSPSLAKGTIDTEVLTAIIQEKQEEIKLRVFRNTIVRQFENGKQSFKNFTTYHYLYNLMQTITSGKNKTAITKAIEESTAEFAYVFGAALFVQAYTKIDTDLKDVKNFDPNDITHDCIDRAKIKYDKKDNLKPSEETKKNIEYFNLLIDICYDVILNDTALQTAFHFKQDKNDASFMSWYSSYNKFLNFPKEGNSTINSNTIREKVKESLKVLSKLIQATNEIKITQRDTLLFELILNQINPLFDLNTNKEMKNPKEFVDDLISNKHIKGEQRLIMEDKLQTIEQLLLFYSDLNKFDFKDFTLTQDQYEAMKFILTKFIRVARNQFDQDIVASLLDFLLENTFLEYGMSQKATNLASFEDKKAYLYVDIEALLLAIDQKFSSITNKRTSIYFKPFFTVGAAYAIALNSNELLTQDNKNISLQNILFAGEKLGLRYIIFNKKYIRAFAVGQKYTYYCNKYKLSKTQPRQPTVDDLHLNFYVSGLLYNLANIKTEAQFNSPLMGLNFGLTFYNGLELNAGFAMPFTNGNFKGQNALFTMGIDIPIIDYITAVAKKRK